MRIAILASVVVAALVAASPATAVVSTFASFSPINAVANFRLLNAGSNKNAVFYTTATGTSTTAGSRNVYFSFLQPGISAYVNNVTAKYTMAGTITNTAATMLAPYIVQDNLTGSFSFLTTAPITIGSTVFATGSNLLSGTFNKAYIAGGRNGTSGGLFASTPTSTVVYTSDFLTFISGSNFDLALSLTSISPALDALPSPGTPTRALRSFRAISKGQFSSDPAPLIPTIPEPAVWLQLIAGFSLVGFAARRRKAAGMRVSA